MLVYVRLTLTRLNLPSSHRVKNIFAQNQIVHSMDENSVRKNISRVRKSLKLTQEEMAEKLGISRIAYRSLEMGDTTLFNDKLEKIAEVAHLSAEEVVLGYIPETDEEPVLNEAEIDYDGSIKDLRKEYEKTIKKLSLELEKEKALNKSLHDTLKAKKEIISLMDSNHQDSK